MCIDTDYFETFNRDNVTLVDLKSEPIERIAADGVVTGKRTYACDAIVLATGFDAMTGTLAKISITGRGGTTLNDQWAEGPDTYLGLMVAGFPNLFLITGPGSPSVLSNMMVSIEQHVEWIARCIDDMRERGATTIEPTPEAQEAWLRHGEEVAAPTVYPEEKSWYTGANVEGKPRYFMAYIGGVPGYRAICDAVAAGGYGGLSIDGGEAAPMPEFMAILAGPQEAEAA
jgi:cyclohexanone monooxygenase